MLLSYVIDTMTTLHVIKSIKKQLKLGEKNEAISICIHLNSDNEITDWSFHLTFVSCSLIVGNDHTEALLSRKSKTRITSRILKPIK